MTLIIQFPGETRANLAEVGGKGLALMRMVAAGLPVPPGAVLTTKFFEPWFDEIQTSAAWASLTSAPPEEWPALSADLQKLGGALAFSGKHREALADLRETLESGFDSRAKTEAAAGGANTLVAVRSSSPDEDLAGASFAGGYRTRLGVRPADLEAAVRDCFASSLDYPVFVYKREHGFDPFSPAIALIVQRQIDSEVAGVGFSLNPLNNDYDEAVFDANRGLGETVVSGRVTPDHFIVDRVDGRVIERRRGDKHLSLRLDESGGVVERTEKDAAEFCLSDARLGELTDMIGRIEKLFDTPIDIEWAYAGDRLYLLQARPITACVPLPPEMLTAPGEPRRLYADAALSKGMTTNAPLSPLELDWMRGFYSFLEEFAGIPASPEDGLMFFAGGRMYINYSNMMWLTGIKKMAKATALNDVLMGAILANIDEGRYRAARRPPWMRPAKLLALPKWLWLLRGMLFRLLRAIVAPERAYRDYRRRADAYRNEMSELSRKPDGGVSIAAFRDAYGPAMARQMFGVSMPVVGAVAVALGLVEKIVGKKSERDRTLAQKLSFGFTGDVVVEMGIALYRLTRLLNASDFEDLNALAERIRARRMPADFQNAYDDFLARYGWRGPLEMDLASPRYADDPRIALRQMSFMSKSNGGEEFDPGAAHRRNVNERRSAYARLQKTLGPVRRVLLRPVYRIIDSLAGTRDAPKDEVVLFKFALRRRVLLEGERLAGAGRLDDPNDVFNLTFPDLEEAGRNPALDLRRLMDENTRFLRLLRERVREFPQVIDSRGRIQRPAPREEQPGELSGMAVSPGAAVGPVKVLYNPHEKRVQPGEVLVAYTTDPGWTPLFVNAAAIVLEVGGILQHGALVAREYGKPCVAGIDRLMTRLHDGQMVEVDGTAGVVRVLDE